MVDVAGNPSDGGKTTPYDTKTDTSRGTYITGFLSRIPGVDTSDEENLIVCLAWMEIENSLCNFNPYGNSRTMPGAKQCPYVTTAKVKAYPDWSTGVTAMAQEITSIKWDTDLVGALRSRSMTAEAKANVIGMSGWNTGPNDPSGTYAGRRAYATLMVAHCGTVRLVLQARLEEAVPGANKTDPGGLGPATPGLNITPPSLKGLTGWADSLGSVLSWLTDSSHWWAIGRVALGVGLVGVGLVLVFKDVAARPIDAAPGGHAVTKAASTIAKAGI